MDYLALEPEDREPEPESESELSGPDLLSLLPIELCYEILSYLDKDERKEFSRCSKWSYYASFRVRFNGVRLSKYQDKIGIQEFGTGGWLEPVKDSIRYLTVDLWRNELHRSLEALGTFPNVVDLKILSTIEKGFERNLCVAVISSLSKLPFYDNLRQITFDWKNLPLPGGITHRRIDLDSDSEEEELRVTYRRGPKEIEMHKTYRHILSRLSPEEKKFLGPFLEASEYSKAARELKFPRDLTKLNFYIESDDASYALPLFDGCNNDKVRFGIFVKGDNLPLLHPNTPENGPAVVPRIKDLRLRVPSRHSPLKLKHIGYQFPDLETLTLPGYASYDPGELWENLPDLPNLQKVEYAWPRKPGQYRVRPSSSPVQDIEEEIEKILKKGLFMALQWVKIREVWMKEEGVVKECVIWREEGDDGEVVRKYGWSTFLESALETADGCCL
ncbi:hypothetical protein TWF718_008627 [Orbilia javanica]|uniref:F-box domain-containing protein n=1 Tax=Orbilia javanica TaxID=47235 RepID=A0AAN8MJZ7_9PEZI